MNVDMIDINRKSRMIRNPFKREDRGSSFIGFLVGFVVIQIIYFYIIIYVGYFKDHTSTLFKLAISKGYSFDPKSPDFVTKKLA